MFAIEGHIYVRATSASRVARCISPDVFANGAPLHRREITADVAALNPGESVTFARIPFRGVDVSRPVVVRRECPEIARTVVARHG